MAGLSQGMQEALHLASTQLQAPLQALKPPGPLLLPLLCSACNLQFPKASCGAVGMAQTSASSCLPGLLPQQTGAAVRRQGRALQQLSSWSGRRVAVRTPLPWRQKGQEPGWSIACTAVEGWSCRSGSRPLVRECPPHTAAAWALESSANSCGTGWGSKVQKLFATSRLLAGPPACVTGQPARTLRAGTPAFAARLPAETSAATTGVPALAVGLTAAQSMATRMASSGTSRRLGPASGRAGGRTAVPALMERVPRGSLQPQGTAWSGEEARECCNGWGAEALLLRATLQGLASGRLLTGSMGGRLLRRKGCTESGAGRLLRALGGGTLLRKTACTEPSTGTLLVMSGRPETSRGTLHTGASQLLLLSER